MTSANSRVPTTTAHQARLRIFQPTRRPVEINEVVKTSWGRVRIRGKLGQSHADLVSAIFYHSKRSMTDQAGRLKILVDPAVISKVCRLEGRTLRDVVDGVMAAVVEILEPERLRCMGHLIDTIKPATRPDGTPITAPNPFGGQRQLWTVVIGEAGMHLLNHDLPLMYNPAPIAAMHKGVSQAIARITLSHSVKKQPSGGWKLDTLIEQVCGQLSPTSMKNRRREIRQDETALAELGVLIKEGRVFRTACSNNPVACSNHPVKP